MRAVFLAHLAATWYMVGLIWFVQVVHYLLFGAVGRSDFGRYADGHTVRTGSVTIAPMVVELVTGAVLVLRPSPELPTAAAWFGLALIGAIWLSTFALQVPQHRALSTGYAERPHRLLVVSNWIRTAAWSARGLLVLWMAATLWAK